MAPRAAAGDLLRQRSLPAQRGSGAYGCQLGLHAVFYFRSGYFARQLHDFRRSSEKTGRPPRSMPRPTEQRQVRRRTGVGRCLKAGWALALRYRANAMISAMVRYRASGISSPSSSLASSFTVGVLVDRHFMFPSDRKNRLGQLIVTLGAEARRVDAVVAQGDGFGAAACLSCFSSTKRCSSVVLGPCGGVPAAAQFAYAQPGRLQALAQMS